MESFGTLLRKKREERNLSIRQLAKYSGVSPAYISQLENNYRKNPTSHVLRALCDGLGIDYDQFLLEVNQLNLQGIKERQTFYQQFAIQEISAVDLHELLEEKREILYKGRTITHEERKKIQTMLQMLLE